MIDRRDILEAASSFSLLPSVVEKDYVLGWVLAGINAHEDLAESWVFKGGTCLKKCYFETYRFLRGSGFHAARRKPHRRGIPARALLEEVVAWVAEQSGLNMPADQLSFDIYENPRGRMNCQGKIAYRGPVSPTAGGWPKIKLDLTADERLVLPAVRREIFHPYTRPPEGGLWANCYAYEEAFGEKLRALGERTRPRDLYDVVNLYRHTDSRPRPPVLRDVLQQKCEYKAIPVPTIEALSRSSRRSCGDVGRHAWAPAPRLAAAERLLGRAARDIRLALSGAEIPQRAFIQHGAGEIAVRTRVLPMGVPVRARSTLEIIRFAAANYLCVDLTYDGSVRRIEPYSLRQTLEGNFVLHAIRSDSGDHRSYRVDRMQGAAVTSQVFTPRYVVELSSTGPLTVAPPAAMPRIAPTPRASASVGRDLPTYIDARFAGRRSTDKRWTAR